MQRTIVQGADLSGTALSDLKSWLGISTPNEDSQLIGLLEASLALCEAFTRQVPLEQTIEERYPSAAGRFKLSARPVQSVLALECTDGEGVRSALGTEAYSVALEAGQTASIAIDPPAGCEACIVRFAAGIAPDWSTLPSALKQGIVRMAAHLYRDRDAAGRDSSPPPASVAALWRPWRFVRLA